jgi:hypothetical protein
MTAAARYGRSEVPSEADEEGEGGIGGRARAAADVEGEAWVCDSWDVPKVYKDVADDGARLRARWLAALELLLRSARNLIDFSDGMTGATIRSWTAS